MTPLAGAAIGAASGALSGALTDFGINDDFMRDVAQAPPPGGAALFVLVRKMTADKVLEELRGTGGTGASFVEGYLITPYVPSKTLSLPPAVLIFSMLAMGMPFEPSGVVLAASIRIVLAAAFTSMREPQHKSAP